MLIQRGERFAKEGILDIKTHIKPTSIQQYVHACMTFTTTYSPHLPAHHLRRLLVKHWHLIQKSPLLSRLFPNIPTVALEPTRVLENSIPEQDYKTQRSYKKLTKTSISFVSPYLPQMHHH